MGAVSTRKFVRSDFFSFCIYLNRSHWLNKTARTICPNRSLLIDESKYCQTLARGRKFMHAVNTNPSILCVRVLVLLFDDIHLARVVGMPRIGRHLWKRDYRWIDFVGPNDMRRFLRCPNRSIWLMVRLFSNQWVLRVTRRKGQAVDAMSNFLRPDISSEQVGAARAVYDQSVSSPFLSNSQITHEWTCSSSRLTCILILSILTTRHFCRKIWFGNTEEHWCGCIWELQQVIIDKHV